MEPDRRGWSRLGKLSLALLLIYFGLNIALFGHAFATGTMLPEQDPSPERMANERFHDRAIGMPLFVASMVAGLATFMTGSAWGIRWLIRGLRSFWNGSRWSGGEE